MRIWDLEREKKELLQVLSRLRHEKRESVRKRVLEIKERIEEEKEKAIVEFCRKFDSWDRAYPLKLSREELAEGRKKVNRNDESILRGMIERVKVCHTVRRTRKKVIMRDGLRVEEDWIPVERVLIYAPGGKASYPSSLIMAAVPAIVAGVREIYVTSPAPCGVVNPHIIACAELLGIENVYRIGGAQAIFAFALGVGEIPKVDMIVGPGNAYVEEAKKECFGMVGLDTVAGPTELLVLAKEAVFPDLVAKDILSQAEHDEMAVIWLFSPNRDYLRQVYEYAEAFADKAPKKEIIRTVLSRNTFLVHYENEENALETINRIAPEHVEVIGNGSLKEKILYAGITYTGITTPTALGDYYIGTNHILPTGGAGRFAGGLSVETFMRKRVIVRVDLSFLKKYGEKAERMAEMEGLYFHKEAIRGRKEKMHEIEGWISKG